MVNIINKKEEPRLYTGDPKDWPVGIYENLRTPGFFFLRCPYGVRLGVLDRNFVEPANAPLCDNYRYLGDFDVDIKVK